MKHQGEDFRVSMVSALVEAETETKIQHPERTFFKSENYPTHSILIVTVKDLIGRFSETFCYVLFCLQHLKGASALCGYQPDTFEPIFILFSHNLCWAAQEYGSDKLINNTAFFFSFLSWG